MSKFIRTNSFKCCLFITKKKSFNIRTGSFYSSDWIIDESQSTSITKTKKIDGNFIHENISSIVLLSRLETFELRSWRLSDWSAMPSSQLLISFSSSSSSSSFKRIPCSSRRQIRLVNFNLRKKEKKRKHSVLFSFWTNSNLFAFYLSVRMNFITDSDCFKYWW